MGETKNHEHPEIWETRFTKFNKTGMRGKPMYVYTCLRTWSDKVLLWVASCLCFILKRDSCQVTTKRVHNVTKRGTNLPQLQVRIMH